MKPEIEVTVDPETMEIKVENKGGMLDPEFVSKLEKSLGIVTKRVVTCNNNGLEKTSTVTKDITA